MLAFICILVYYITIQNERTQKMEEKMSRPTYLQTIKERIAADKTDSVYIPSDFFDIADSARVGICLRRIVKSGALIRVMRGVYVKPFTSKLPVQNITKSPAQNIAKPIAQNIIKSPAQNIAKPIAQNIAKPVAQNMAKPIAHNIENPYALNIAKAIARNYGWTIAPCGETALFLTGMVEEPPAEWTYISDGTYQAYNAGGIKLVFKHTVGKNELSGVHELTALYIQALRAIGKTNITSDIIRTMAKKVKYSDRPKIIHGTQRITAWVRARLNEIYDESFKIQTYSDYTWQNPYRSYNQNNQNAKQDINQINNRDNKPISTFFGYNVGSKSEAIIAASLHMAGLEYSYEKPLHRRGLKPLKPDFTISYKSRVFYWEHLGMLDNKGYEANWNEKSKWYKANLPPEQLLTTTEAEDIGAQIDRIIKGTFKIDIRQLIKDSVS